MSTKDKKSVASQALLEMDAITNALKEESKKSLNTLLAEAVKSALREGCEDEDDAEEDEYEVFDDNDKKENEKKDQNGKSKKKAKKSETEAGNPDEMGQGQQSGDAPMTQPQGENPQMGGQQGVSGQGRPGEMDAMQQPHGEGEMPQGGEETAPEAGNDGEGWDEFSDYQVGDDENTLDLTQEEDYDKVVKVYKLLNDDDQVVVKTDGDKLQLKDNEAGTEYVIDLGSVEDDGQDMEEPDMKEPYEGEGEEEMPGGLNEEFMHEDEDFNDDEFGDFDDEEFEDEEPDHFDDDKFGNDEFDFAGIYDDDHNPDYDGVPRMIGADHNENPDWDGDEDWSDDEFEDELYENKKPGNNKNKKNKKPMRESKNNVLFEVDLGYTDNYQDKDPIAGLSNNEPAKGKKSWHKGVPTGTSKPWAGDSKSKGDPFKTTQKVEGSVNEEEDGLAMDDLAGLDEHVSGAVKDRSMGAKTKVPNINGKHGASEKKKHATVGTEYHDEMNESKELKAIKNENKELKKAVIELRKNLNEAYITNVNLGKITKLFLENATSQKEKIEIVNRFANEAKSIEQSKMLYESINKELKKGQKQGLNLNESSVTANGTKVLNEQKVYKSDDLLKTIDFMNRVLGC